MLGPMLPIGRIRPLRATGPSTHQRLTFGDADLPSVGDLPERIRNGRPLNRYDRSTFYGGGRRG